MAKQTNKKTGQSKKTTSPRKKASAATKPSTVRKAASSRTNGRKVASRKAPAPEAVAAEPVEQEVVKTYLSDEELDEFRQILMIKRAEIVGDLATLNKLHKDRYESTGNLSSMPLHPADAGSDNFEQEFTLGLVGTEQVLLGEIEEAIQRIAEGTYGICVATNQKITRERLRAKPWAKHCIEYARSLEKPRPRRI